MAGRDVLPGARRAVVPREKLEDYLLDPAHPIGGHKARVFAAALGIRRNDRRYLRDRLEAAIVDAPVTPSARRRGAGSTKPSSRSKG